MARVASVTSVDLHQAHPITETATIGFPLVHLLKHQADQFPSVEARHERESDETQQQKRDGRVVVHPRRLVHRGMIAVVEGREERGEMTGIKIDRGGGLAKSDWREWCSIYWLVHTDFAVASRYVYINPII